MCVFVFQIKVIVNTLKNVVNAFVPSGKIMQIVDEKLVRNCFPYITHLHIYTEFGKHGIYLGIIQQYFLRNL